MSKKEEARRLHDEGFNCAQRTFCALCGETGHDRETALRIASGFGAGMQQGEICGVVSAAVMALGLMFGHTNGRDAAAKAKMYALVRRFHEEFSVKRGSLLCREIAGCDPSTKEGAAFAKEHNVYATTCAGIIDDAIDIFEELYQENCEG